MVALKIWYQQPEGGEDGTIVIATAIELDAFIDRMLDAGKTHRCPPMIQAVIADGPRLPILQVGLGQEKGFIGYAAKDGGWTHGDGDAEQKVEYVYMGNLSEVPANVEVPLEDVREGLREFMETGQRPRIVTV